MAFTGKWKRTKFENHEEILKHIGMPKEVAKKMKNTDGILEIEQDGNTFNEVLTYGEKVTKSVLIVGKPSQFHTWNDDRVEVVPVEIGTNKIKVEYDHGGVHHCATRELITEAQFVDHINLDKGKLTGKIMYTKC